MDTKIRVGIVGGAGYTAGELLRILIHHPNAEITFVNSSSNAGNPIADIHEGLIGETELQFTSELPLNDIDVLFLCSAHGDSRKFLEAPFQLAEQQYFHLQGFRTPAFKRNRAIHPATASGLRPQHQFHSGARRFHTRHFRNRLHQMRPARRRSAATVQEFLR